MTPDIGAIVCSNANVPRAAVMRVVNNNGAILKEDLSNVKSFKMHQQLLENEYYGGASTYGDASLSVHHPRYHKKNALFGKDDRVHSWLFDETGNIKTRTS